MAEPRSTCLAEAAAIAQNDRLSSPPPAVGVGRVDAVRVDLAVERADVDAQIVGGELAVAVAALERFGDEQLLDGLQAHGLALGSSAPGCRAQLRRQVAQLDQPAAAEHERLLDDVLQLADVARVVVLHQAGQHLVRNAGDVLALEAVELGDQVVDQQGDVLAALGQAGQGPGGPRGCGSRGPRGTSPVRTSLARFLLVAAITRTSTGTGLTPPSGSTTRSWSTRSSRTCMAGEMSPISSRKIVPPSASANRPGLSRLASVNAPALWPNSSLSSSVSGRAAQLTATKGFFLRGERLWIARANSSLPVPLGPSISTVVLLAAIWGRISNRRIMAGLRPTMSSKRVAGLELLLELLDLREVLEGLHAADDLPVLVLQQGRGDADGDALAVAR